MRKEKALYIAMLCQGNGGIRFSKPRGSSAAEEKRHEERMRRFQARYAAIYRRLGAESDRIPDVTSATIRNPMIASIRRAISERSDLYNPEDYTITNTGGSYAVHIDPELIRIVNGNGQKEVPLHSSKLYRDFKSL